MPKLYRVRHTVIVSDVHLCEGVPGDEPWMRWRSRPFFPDAEFSALVDRLLAEARGASVELVFNGDLFDFDASRVIDGHVTEEDLPRTEPVAVELLERILRDHDGYVAALGRLLAAGHAVVFIAGNHDPQLAYPAVRALLRSKLVEASGDPSAGARVRFRGWFYQTPDGVHIEHGNQYDPYCAFRYPLMPHHPEAGEIQPTFGSLTFRHLISRMGYFNPHVDASWMLGLRGYVAHWAKHYLFSKRSLASTWLLGAVRAVKQLAHRRDPGSPARAALNLDLASSETGVARAVLARHAALFAPPVEDSIHRAVRELWLDRLTLAAVCAAAVATPVFLDRRVAIPLALGLPALFGLYEALMPKPALDDIYAHIERTGAEIAAIHGCRAVVFGHTHVPYGRWVDGVFHGNSGTWTAAFEDEACSVPVDPHGKPVIWLRADGARLEGGLYRWRNGHLLPDPGAAPERAREAPAGAVVALRV